MKSPAVGVFLPVASPCNQVALQCATGRKRHAIRFVPPKMKNLFVAAMLKALRVIVARRSRFQRSIAVIDWRFSPARSR
jgi:hypothetical protein